MGKWLGAVAVAAVLSAGGPIARPASADDMNMTPGAPCSPSGASTLSSSTPGHLVRVMRVMRSHILTASVRVGTSGPT